MTIDIRANVYCSLGPVISGSVSDSGIPDNGLVLTTGSVTLAGLFKPAIGTSIAFSYAKNGIIAKIPRSLLVISSFADPFRNQTTIEFGCPLTYKSNLGPLESEEPDEQPTSSLADSYKIPPRISARTIFQNCCSKIGVGGIAPLTNEFIVDEFDYSGGYVSTMADLLKSECYLGYIDSNGTLSVVTTMVSGGGGPVLTEQEIIDISSTGSGDIPGEAVSVAFNSKQLKPPNDEDLNGPGGFDDKNGDGTPDSADGCSDSDIATQKRNWEFEANNPDETIVYDKYKDPLTNEDVVDEYRYVPWSWTRTTYDVWDRAVYRFEVQNGLIDQVWRSTWWTYEVPAPVYTGGSATNKCANWWFNDNGRGSVADQYGSGKFSFTIETDPEKTKNEGKPDNYSNIVMEEVWEETPKADIIQACGFAENWYPNIRSFPIGRWTTLQQYTYYEKDEASGISKVKTVKYIPYVQTPEGSYSIGKRAEVVTAPGAIDQFRGDAGNGSIGGGWYGGSGVTGGSGGILEDTVADIIIDASQLVQYGGETKIRTEREFGLQRRPSAAERLVKYQNAPLDQEAELKYTMGSDKATSGVQFQMPYAPDDKITAVQNGTQVTYTTAPSDAPEKATNYGRMQNRFLMGSNSAISIQVAPENMPPYPLKPIFIKLNGITGQYMTNAQTWTFDANGIIASCDALYWGAAGSN